MKLLDKLLSFIAIRRDERIELKQVMKQIEKMYVDDSGLSFTLLTNISANPYRQGETE